MRAGVKLLWLTAVIFAAAVGARYVFAQGNDRPSKILPTRFEFTDGNDEFVFELHDPVLIQQARKYLMDPGTAPLRVAGRIAETRVDYNPKWSFHLQPGSVQFFKNSIQVCNASIFVVQENLTYVGGSFLPGRWWCPWESHLTRELPGVPTQYITQ
ncbi:MAG TPA: hypothetical protein VF678_16850, partial [bacterium]